MSGRAPWSLAEPAPAVGRSALVGVRVLADGGWTAPSTVVLDGGRIGAHQRELVGTKEHPVTVEVFHKGGFDPFFLTHFGEGLIGIHHPYFFFHQVRLFFFFKKTAGRNAKQQYSREDNLFHTLGVN